MKSTATQNSFAVRQQMEIGRAISKQLDPLLTQQETADRLGISAEAVRKIEYLALAKVAARIKLKVL